MAFFAQTWTLAKKDLLLVAQRRWFSTLVRAFLLPIVFTAVISYVRILNTTHGRGIGTPSPVLSLPEAFGAAVIDNGLVGNDVQSVINEIAQPFRDAGKEVIIDHDDSRLFERCPSSSRGVTKCWGAIEFWSSPDKGKGEIWNYTLVHDGVMGSSINVMSDRNPWQVYALPLQHAVDSAIARADGGSLLPDNVMQYTYTGITQKQQNYSDKSNYETTLAGYLVFAYFIGMCGITFHLTGHITRQREQGILQLIDAMMPNQSRWHCLTARLLSVHLAFDIIYAPGWIIAGAIASVITFPETNPGWLILLYLLTGLALTGYAIFVSSLFKKVQISAISSVIAALVFAIVAQFAEGAIKTATVPGVLATAVLFPPSAFVYFLIDTAEWEEISKGLNAGSSSPENIYWSVPAATFIGLLIFHIFLYPILGAVVERWLHGSSSKNRLLRPSGELGGNAIRLQGFSKRYNVAAKKRDRIQAVDDLSLGVHAGSITILLGSNGSGKSTTLKAIAGLESITSGSIELDGTGGIGYCPQQNVMWGDMTVLEHVMFFQRLKNPSLRADQSKAEAERLIAGCDLDIKIHAKAKTLSGGQKRKLQLAMMLAGGSRVCCIDEASSGIDPLARRKIWDILLQERGRRTMLLTTHFLDESEVLSDHVAILSKGMLKAEGSVASLKNSIGGGYRVVLQKDEKSLRYEDVSTSITQRQDYNHTVYEVPDTTTLARFIAYMDNQRIANYAVHGPTMDDVFIGLSEEMFGLSTENELLSIERPPGSNASETRILPETAVPMSMKLNTGNGCGPIRQTGVLFMKRLTVLKHNYMPYVAALFLPLVMIGMVTRLLISPEYDYGLPCIVPGSEAFDQTYYTYPETTTLNTFYFGPLAATSKSELESLLPDGGWFVPPTYQPLNWQRTQLVNSSAELYAAMKSYVGQTSQYAIGGVFVGEGQATFAYEADLYDAVPSAVFTQSILDQVLTNTSIAFAVAIFSQGFLPFDFIQGLIIVFTTLGFAVYPGFFALYPTAERLRNVRAMQYSNGILSSSLWAAHALFDGVFILLIGGLATIIWQVCMGAQIYGIGYVFVIFLLYGMAGTAYSYVISLFMPSQLSAIAVTSLVQSVIAMCFFVGCVISQLNGITTNINVQLDYIYYTMGLICPAVSLMRALMVALNLYGLACHGQAKASYPGGIELFGAPIVYLIIQFLLLVCFLMFWESGRSLEVFGIHLRKKQSPQSQNDEISDKHMPSDAMEDEKHLAHSNDGLRVHNMSKTFGSTNAVSNISFGILPSEKFALLGPNGAGKSTTISLIRGELHPDHSNPPSSVFISNDSLMHAPVTAKQHLGVCPQFDAVDSMTLREHLFFYARARGVPDPASNIAALIACLGLAPHSNKLVRKLSGGTKRKLSLAIALVANPSVLLLDEPSSGMDAAAKRALWATLRSVAADRCLLITTHSMEEADALCDRAGIMAGKMLALDSIPRLRERFGDKVYIHLVHKNAPYTTDDEAEALWRWVRGTFTVVEAEQRTFGGQVRFAVPVQQEGSGSRDGAGGDGGSGKMMGRLFRMIEEAKEEVGIADYSIGPTTLDQVFMNVVSRHNVAEENTMPDKRVGRKKWWRFW